LLPATDTITRSSAIFQAAHPSQVRKNWHAH
jgi:hypothetical protein